MVLGIVDKAEDVCEACLDAFYDEMGPFITSEATEYDIRTFLVLMGGETADHICDRVEDSELKCACACNERRAEFAN